jgi:adhesin transport system membrane fusion protein|tara:strand:+ start:211 stop:1548 length:1338 start_codon:yes stop_codon:yes gene_type:complete
MLSAIKNKFRQDAQNKQNLDFVTDASLGQLMHTPRTGHYLLVATSLLVVSLLVWASLSSINEVVRAEGKAIPISHTQVIQNLEGGIVKSLLVREGQAVKKGQLLMELDETSVAGGLVASVAETSSLLSEEIRLAAEVNSRKPDFTDERKANHEKYVDTQLQLYNLRQQDLAKNINDFRLKKKKIEQELNARQQQRRDLHQQLKLIQQQLKMNEPLLDMGAISVQALLEIKQNINRVKTEENKVTNQIPGLESEVDRLDQQAESILLDFKKKAQQQLSEVRMELDIAQSKQAVSKANVDRTQIKSPVDGVVQKIYINTIGGIARPGMQLIDVVPVNDEILVEAKVKPKDIGFLKKGQAAKVKITAFDFALYGGLDGKVETVSADTIVDKKGNSFYIIKIRVEKAYFDEGDDKLQVIPGMTASVDISVAQRSVLHFVLKPLLRVLKR